MDEALRNAREGLICLRRPGYYRRCTNAWLCYFSYLRPPYRHSRFTILMVQNLKRKRNEAQRTGDEDTDGLEFEDDMIDNGAGSSPKYEGSEGVSSMDEDDGKGSNKPPTGEELRAIKDASDLFKSSSFKLQIDALPPNVRPKTSKVPPLERFLFELYAILQEIPSETRTGKSLSNHLAKSTLLGARRTMSASSRRTLLWKCPIEGLPRSRFFHKRSFYLATIATAIQKSKSGPKVDLSYESLQGDPRLTKLVLTTKNDDSPTDFTKLNAKAALEFLAKHNFKTDAVFVKSPEGHRFPPEEYKEHQDAVAYVPLGSLELLRYDALITLELLNHTSFSRDPFNSVFLKDSRDLSTRFDVILRSGAPLLLWIALLILRSQVNLVSAKPRSNPVHSTIDLGSPSNALLVSISGLIRRGLGDRSRAVALLHPSSLPRPVSQAHPSSPDTVFIGLIHNPQHTFRLVDHGPAADKQDQSVLDKFRALWGDKSELRRFKYGRIVQSVVWKVTTADERPHVPSMIVRHLLKWHFGLEENAVETWQTSYDSLLRLPPSISREYISSGVSTGFKGALTAFDNLVKQIKKLDDELPLSLLNVSPISEALRCKSVFSPVPLP
ncbi:hypothetical protein GALMADRAFT_148991 [Galerina marginata CBS 339.88]|uniref:U3 small nucleolar RNA-associated protein 22 n=1 Tax=Galerina marginata (strain CBS 339.88) TaxID=685588 RepID=A0A067S2Q2_GALM3|nr:hypothetical protein GALMADRAFT_148991 [Galerina marginata CBS 339.88]